MNPSTLQIFATVIFFLAILHTFTAPLIEKFSHRFDEHSSMRNLFHLLSEVEAVFGFWSVILIIGMILIKNLSETLAYIDQINYTEPVFVFVIMFMAATKPIIVLADYLIFKISKLIPINPEMSFYLTTLIIGPLLGSFITEPGAMTVCSMILLNTIFKKNVSLNFKYATLGLLFVNVSIGGTLTHFAAPPVVMVASKWGWDMNFMFGHYGYKALLSVILSTTFVALLFRKEFQGKHDHHHRNIGLPFFIVFCHVMFITVVVFLSHHMSFFLAVFFSFLGFKSVTKKYQREPKLRESIMVGLFLAGLVTIGSLQAWWLQLLISHLSDSALYLGATALTAVTDNAALTYLGSLVSLSESAKYFLVAGAVVGGGLTVIANAPNPVGYGILKEGFPQSEVSAYRLFIAAFGPTLVALILIGFLPNLN